MTYRVYGKIQISSFFRFDRLRRWTAGDAVLLITTSAQHEGICFATTYRGRENWKRCGFFSFDGNTH